MKGNREINKPSDKTEMSSVSRRSENTIDFATGHNLRRKEKEHKTQSELSQSKITEDHFTYKTSLEISRINIDTKSLEIRDTYQREINALKITLLGHTGGIKILKNKINETQQKVKELGDKKYFSLIDIYGYKGLYDDLEKEHNFIKKEITRLEEKYYASSKKSEALETEVNGLNSDIASKEQKQKELISQFSKLTTEHNKTQEEYTSIIKEIGTQVDSPSKNLNDLQEEIENNCNLKKNLQLEIEKSKEKISRKKAEKRAIKAKLGEIKTLSQYSQEMRERKRYS